VLTFRTNAGGLKLAGLTFNNEAAQSTPFSVTVVVGSQTSVGAPSPQTFNRSTYFFSSWSDGGPQNHTITAPAMNTTYTPSTGSADGSRSLRWVSGACLPLPVWAGGR